jgi:hypothetical protein
MSLLRLWSVFRAVAAVAVIVAVAVLAAPGLSRSPSVAFDPAGAPGGQCRDGAVVVGWVIDEAYPHLTTGVRVGGLSDDCSHNKIKVEVLDEQGNVLTALVESLSPHGGEVTLDFASPILAAPVAEVEVVLSGATRP